ncbi:MAG TPA: SAM-dependent chlorinase/fluorinase [Jiangellaceae bacterium]|nr:SAM-dependent chlorinase/fluorinase [Jiangellaceae bacterium]
MRYDWVGLLTDYGLRDGFVAACHGIIAQRAPSVRVIDITHDIPPQDIRHGAAVLAQAVPYLPPAVIVGVVDPGVGTSRRGVAIEAGASVLVGPDNGLLTWAAKALGGGRRAVSLDAAQYHLPVRAGTFDGRDVFAPVAAHIADGVRLDELGAPVPDLVVLPDPVVEIRDGRLTTEVLTVDHFGNVQLAAQPPDLAAAHVDGPAVTVETRGQATDISLGTTFASVGLGQLVCYVDSAGHLALAVNHGRAADVLRVRPGDQVVLA